MKYLFLDTNIYIGCCLLQTDEDNFNMNDILKLLDENNNIKLILPEIVELEFYSSIDAKFRTISNNIDLIKKNIASGEIKLSKCINKEIIEKLNEIIKKRELNIEKVKKIISKIFSHKNTKKITLNSDIFLETLKYSITKKKPFKNKVAYNNGCVQIQNDCLIVETMVNFFKNTKINKTDKLVFCSLNVDDFSSDNKKNKEIIHDDIKTSFGIPIKYYTNILKMLNEEFKQKYTSKDITEVSKLSDTYSHIQDAYASYFDIYKDNICEECGGVSFSLTKNIDGKKICLNCSFKNNPAFTSSLSALKNVSENSVYLKQASYFANNNIGICCKCGHLGRIKQLGDDDNGICEDCLSDNKIIK